MHGGIVRKQEEEIDDSGRQRVFSSLLGFSTSHNRLKLVNMKIQVYCLFITQSITQPQNIPPLPRCLHDVPCTAEKTQKGYKGILRPSPSDEHSSGRVMPRSCPSPALPIFASALALVSFAPTVTVDVAVPISGSIHSLALFFRAARCVALHARMNANPHA